MVERMSRPVRAMQVWQVLIAAAHERRTLTYGDVADLLGFEGAGVLAQTLGLIMNYCKKNNLPPLTILVVNKGTGIPGEGLTTVQNLPEDREAVYNEQWYRRSPVQISDFQEIADRT
jgi:alkylated DNA nucleotide flippase Atl1